MVTEKFSKELVVLAKSFNSGNAILDAFIKSDEAFDQSVGVTYVWLNKDKSEVIGYYNISSGTFDFMENDSRIKQCGAAHINYFAITENYQGIHHNEGGSEYKLSDILLIDCISRISEIRNDIGFGCITLSSTQQGYNLYKRADFEELEEDNCFSDTAEEKKTIDMYYMLDVE